MSKSGKAFYNWQNELSSAVNRYGKILTDMPDDEFSILIMKQQICRKTVGFGPGDTDVQIKKYELLNHSEKLFRKLDKDRKTNFMTQRL